MTVGKLLIAVIAIGVSTALLTTCAVNSCTPQARPVAAVPVAPVAPVAGVVAPVAAPVAVAPAAPVIVSGGHHGGGFGDAMVGAMAGSMLANAANGGGGRSHTTIVNKKTVVNQQHRNARGQFVKRPSTFRKTSTFSGFRRKRSGLTKWREVEICLPP